MCYHKSSVLVRQLRDYGYPEQWGLESTYQEYLKHLWSLMDEIWRVLKDDGTVWINLGDTYFSKTKGSGGYDSDKQKSNVDSYFNNLTKLQDDIPYKCLMLIPHRFAIGCIDRGWILRNDIIWAKRNAMPESVTDRFSKKHEFIFFFVKNQKYYFDLDKIRNKHLGKNKIRESGNGEKRNFSLLRNEQHPNGKNPGDVSDFWDIPTHSSSVNHYATYNTQLIDKPIIAGCPEGGTILDPFNGSGTTTLRAEQLNRKWIGIELSQEYCEIAKRRIENEREQLKLEFV